MGMTVRATGRVATLTSLCDTLLPALSHEEQGECGRLLERPASELRLGEVVETMVNAASEDVRAEIVAALDRLASEGFADASLARREELLRAELGGQAIRQVAGTRARSLLRGERRGREEPELAGNRLPGADYASAVARSGAEDDRGRAPRGPAGRHRRGCLRGRLRSGRIRHCRGPAVGRKVGRGARTRPVPQ